MAHKILINETGYPLDVQLLVRRGDSPTETADTVKVALAPHDHRDDATDEKDSSTRRVTYGNQTNIYLNGVELSLTRNGERQISQRVVAERGSELDNALNMNDTLEFRFDGKNIGFTASNSDTPPPTWKLTPLTPLKPSQTTDPGQGPAGSGSA